MAVWTPSMTPRCTDVKTSLWFMTIGLPPAALNIWTRRVPLIRSFIFLMSSRVVQGLVRKEVIGEEVVDAQVLDAESLLPVIGEERPQFFVHLGRLVPEDEGHREEAGHDQLPARVDRLGADVEDAAPDAVDDRVVGLHLVHELDHDLAARGRFDAIGELHLFMPPMPILTLPTHLPWYFSVIG